MKYDKFKLLLLLLCYHILIFFNSFIIISRRRLYNNFVSLYNYFTQSEPLPVQNQSLPLIESGTFGANGS